MPALGIARAAPRLGIQPVQRPIQRITIQPPQPQLQIVRPALVLTPPVVTRLQPPIKVENEAEARAVLQKPSPTEAEIAAAFAYIKANHAAINKADKSFTTLLLAMKRTGMGEARKKELMEMFKSDYPAPSAYSPPASSYKSCTGSTVGCTMSCTSNCTSWCIQNCTFCTSPQYQYRH